MDLRIARQDPLHPAIAVLLALHMAESLAISPPGAVHALPPERLRADDLAFYAGWFGAELAVIGALKRVAPGHGEIKSMRAAPQWRGQGVGRVMLMHLLAEARAAGMARISLETGRSDPFVPARRLYTAAGFAECPPFADYTDDGFSLCMTRML